MIFEIPGDLKVKSDGTGLEFSSGADRLRQRMLVGFGTGLGSWVFDQNVGFPLQDLLVGNLDLQFARTLIHEYLAGFDEVSNVDDVAIEVTADRRALVSYSVTMTDGEPVKDSFLL